MSYPKNFPGEIQIGIVASGGDPKSGDHPEDHSSGMKIASPLEHGSGVKPEHLAFSPMMASPDSATSCQFKGALPPGTPVYFLKTSGQSGGIILGQANPLMNSGQRTPGNMDLMQPWSQFPSMDMGISGPPQIQETTERGAKVRKIQESGDMFSLDTLKGLPLHGALFDMSGFKLPEIKKVPTAKQQNSKMMTQNIMDQLPGSIMSLGQMFSKLKSKGPGYGNYAGGGYGTQTGTDSYANTEAQVYEVTYMDQITESLTPEMKDAVNSLSNLIQGMEVSGGVTFVTGGVVHEGIYLENARDLLSQVTSLADLMYVLQRLQWDDQLTGREALSNVEVQIETAWGVALQEIDVDGTITVTYANTDSTNAISEFANTMSSVDSSPSVGSDSGSGGTGGGGGGGSGAGGAASQAQGMLGNMFGKSSGVMQEMWKRLHPQGEQFSKQLHEKVNQGQSSRKMKNIVDATLKGQGDPTNKQHYDQQ